MKKAILLILALLCICGKGFSYDVPVCVTINGEYADCDGTYIEDGVTYVPFKAVSNAFNAANVAWDDGSKTASADIDGVTISVTKNSDVAYVEHSAVKMNGAAAIKNGRMYVPIRFFAESIGADVKWMENYYRVEITKADTEMNGDYALEKDYDDTHIYWLAKIIHSESRGESMTGKIAVGNVIMNRVASDEFPDTIYSVIFDRNNGVQFQPTVNGEIYREPLPEAYIAAKLVLNGENAVGDCLYFLNPKTASDFWIVNNRNYFTTIGNHDFYL